MTIGIIDAEIIGVPKHRFPNLCCMKISGYHKSMGDDVQLLFAYDGLTNYDKVYISKVFTKTPIPEEVLELPNVEYGGTGFYYDKAPPLPQKIEHAFPDYHLYDEWVNKKISEGIPLENFDYYLNYSIGYLTRKCFRKCEFCVNQNYTGVEVASPLIEFMDITRPKLCFLDDNFLGHPKWKELIQPVIASGKPFQFKQGLDERLLTEEKIIEISKWKYDGEVIFAFDNIKDKDIIISKLELIRRTVPNWKRELKFYVFCGWDKNNIYDENFFRKDIHDLFERITILRAYNAKPYIMRFEKVYKTEYSSFYATVAAYCNQPSMFNSFTFRVYAQCRGMRKEDYKIYKRDIARYLQNVSYKGSEWRSMEMIEHRFPEIAEEFYDIDKNSNLTNYRNNRSHYE